MNRIPEPELMDSPPQVDAYDGADFAEPNRFFTDILLERFGSRLEKTGHMVDLGCGPGNISIRLARLLPGWQITGLDAGPNMLDRAGTRVREEGLEDRIRLVHAHLPEMPGDLRDFDLVISNSLLHHLPDPMVLWHSITRLARPGGLVQVMDLQRPDSPEIARELVSEHAGNEPEILQEDFYNSLRAAWTIDEVGDQLARAGLDGLSIRSFTSRHWLVQGTIGSRT